MEDWRLAAFQRDWRGRDGRVIYRPPGTTASARPWSKVCDESSEQVIPDFAMRPRTVLWCVQWLLREGGPVQHHEAWKSRRKLGLTDFGVSEHHTLSTILEDLCVTDALDTPNLLAAERLCRKLQMIEYFWDEKQREQDAAQQRMPVEEVNAFMGGTGSSARPSSMVCLTMIDHISKELERVGNIKRNAQVA